MIVTNEARCRDCYRCLRACPVKAIRISASEETGALYARVIEELCVKDARCVLTCPQKAKRVTSSLAEVRHAIKNGEFMVASVAPSFVVGFPLADPGQIPALLRKLGFKKVQETSLGAALVARQHCRMGFERAYVSSACPVVVNLVERHYPEALPYLAPVVSPMIAHGRYLKESYPGCQTVFIGPCAAKKDEALASGVNDAIDYVLGFDELWEWVQEENIDAGGLAADEFDGPGPGLARLFPIDGGMLKTVGASKQADEGFITLSGLQNCIDFIKHLASGGAVLPGLVELLACSGGCINGPLMLGRDESIFNRRRKIIEYQRSRCSSAGDDSATITGINEQLLQRNFMNRKVVLPLPGEAEIKEILERSGKFEPEDELNCGACGFDTCRDKAVAVYQGNAEPEMCIPYMRKRAESMSNRVLGAMPNAVVILDDELVIRETNPAAVNLFKRSIRELVGQKLEQFLEISSFREVVETGKMINQTRNYDQIGKIVREIIFPLEKERSIVGILVDITAEKRRHEQYELLKGQTISRAQEVITKQMTVAQEIAGLLGETTAETKVLLTKLIELMQEDPF